jgi:hypothetical protein
MRCVPTRSGDLDASDLVSFYFAPDGVREVEAASSQRNEVRRPSVHFVVSLPMVMAMGLHDASFSDFLMADVGGGWYLVLVDECVEQYFGILVGGFGTGEDFVSFFLCVGVQILHGFRVAECAHGVSSLISLEAINVAAGGRRSFFYQLERSGWSLLPTCSGGSSTLQGSLSSGDLEFPAVHEASYSSLPVDDGH